MWGIRDWGSAELNRLIPAWGLSQLVLLVCIQRVPLWDNPPTTVEDNPLAGFFSDPLYWGAIM